MTRAVQQRISIVNRDGASTVFEGDNFRLITGPMGFRWVLNEHSEQVWLEPSVQQGGPATVTVANARPDYAPGLTSEQAMGMAPPTVPPPLLDN